jgi:FKBP12-rapamycin complex-associated protein
VRRKINAIARSDGGRLRHLEEYEAIVSLMIKGRCLPRLPESALQLFQGVSGEGRKSLTLPTSNKSNEPLPINLKMLEQAWGLSGRAEGRTAASDYIEWYKRLTYEFIRQSPTSIIRQCASLANSYRPLAQELLNASFISLWDKICPPEILNNAAVVDVSLIRNLESALKNKNIPNNITVAILNLTVRRTIIYRIHL